MSIVGVQDIGPIGPHQSEPTHYYWPIYWHMAPLVLLAVLALLLFRAANRRKSAGWVLLLALVLPFLCSRGMDWSGITQFAMFLHDTAAIFFFAVAFIWLLADALGGLTRVRTVVRLVLLLILAGLIGLLNYAGPNISPDLLPTALTYAALVFAAFLAMALAGVACRKRYSRLRYSIWFFIMLVPGIGGVLASLIGLVLLAWDAVVTGSLPSSRYLYYHFEEVFKIGLIGGVALFVFMLPFLALAFWNPMFRSRFHAIFRLPGMDCEPVGCCNNAKEVFPPDEPEQSGTGC